MPPLVRQPPAVMALGNRSLFIHKNDRITVKRRGKPAMSGLLMGNLFTLLAISALQHSLFCVNCRCLTS
ncbi:hypothetical protein CKO_03462 [Citrobacter koseri ATCC BAA-895]|uniref:Uncharacterized protein n=1 Tax=Citrobacter koseri (strain ATCC BAA-895 / CDC 4225-83 / SGSC4696) TaxID=290338 RepID=A8AM29_CITK8|nr:hypothetical protein CKO_03462 [Citrobacter koseri ATCC BAA-895]